MTIRNQYATRLESYSKKTLAVYIESLWFRYLLQPESELTLIARSAAEVRLEAADRRMAEAHAAAQHAAGKPGLKARMDYLRAMQHWESASRTWDRAAAELWEDLKGSPAVLREPQPEATCALPPDPGGALPSRK